MKYLLSLLLLGIVFQSRAQMQSVSTVSTEDTYVEYISPSAVISNNSLSTTTSIQVSGSGTTIKRTLLKFDIASLNIPSGAVIYSAYIRLRISGTESAVPNPAHFTVSRATTSWNEATVNYPGPTPESSDATANSYTDGGATYRFFDVAAQLRNIVLNPALNLGFIIRKSSETTNGSYTYHTSNHATSSFKPALIIQYYLPYTITAAAVNPTSATGASDGSITPTISGGPHGSVILAGSTSTTTVTPTYEWFNGTTGSVISGVTSSVLSGYTYGWYGLKIYNTASIGNPVYMGFMVGVKCQEVTVNFNPGPNYIDDLNASVTVGTSPNGNSTTMSAAYAGPGLGRNISLIRFRLWMDPSLSVTQSNLLLASSGHVSSPSNESIFHRNTENWDEYPSYYLAYFLPAYYSAGMTKVVPHQAATLPLITTVDLNDYWNYWKLDNPANYGLRFSRNSSTVSGQNYHSSDATNSTNRPYIQFKINRPCPTLSYSQLKAEPDGGYCMTSAGILKFYFDETYAIAPGKYLPLKIYDKNRVLKAHVTLNGTVVVGPIVAQNYTFDDNRCQVSLTSLGLTYGEMYLLEAETSTGEKRYLKFIYKD